MSSFRNRNLFLCIVIAVNDQEWHTICVKIRDVYQKDHQVVLRCSIFDNRSEMFTYIKIIMKKGITMLNNHFVLKNFNWVYQIS